VVRALALCAVPGFTPALAGGDEDSVAILEFGASAEREISERTSHVGPAVGIEVEPIEDLLEIEFGAATSRSHVATNWELDLPFKLPLRLATNIELMPGLGPTWAHTTAAGERSSTWGGEMVLDLFVWRNKRFGWFLEPSYGITFGAGNKKSASLTAGFFFAVPSGSRTVNRDPPPFALSRSISPPCNSTRLCCFNLRDDEIAADPAPAPER
jgi:hypothetical protein